MADTIHQGRNIKRFREMLGLKQEGLAYELGDDWNQKKVSLLEQKEVVDAVLLEQVAKVLKVPADAIKNLTDEGAVNIISNTFNEGSFLNTGHIPTFNINPLDRIIQLHNEKIALYERMLKEKDEMMAKLERLMDRNNK